MLSILQYAHSTNPAMDTYKYRSSTVLVQSYTTAAVPVLPVLYYTTTLLFLHSCIKANVSSLSVLYYNSLLRYCQTWSSHCTGTANAILCTILVSLSCTTPTTSLLPVLYVVHSLYSYCQSCTTATVPVPPEQYYTHRASTASAVLHILYRCC